MVTAYLLFNRQGLGWRKAWCLLYVVVYFIHQNKRRAAPLGSTELDLKRLCSSMIQSYLCLAAQYLSHQYHLIKLGFIHSATLVTNELWQGTNPSKNNSTEARISSTQPQWHQNKTWWDQWRYSAGTGLGVEVVLHKEWLADMFSTFVSSIFPLLFMFVSQTILLSIMYIESYLDQIVLLGALWIGRHVLESFYITAIPHTLPYSNTKWVIHSPRVSASSAFLSPFRDGIAQARRACSCGGSSIRELVLVFPFVNISKPLIESAFSCGLLSSVQHFPHWAQFGYSLRYYHGETKTGFAVYDGVGMDLQARDVIVIAVHLLSTDPVQFTTMRKTAIQPSKEMDACMKQVRVTLKWK